MIDLTGRRFEKLTVVRRHGTHVIPSGQKCPTWLVMCDCGTAKIVMGMNLRSGQVRSCGCLRRPHGMFGTPEYSAWASMIQRCTNPKTASYRTHGARGILVCKEWLKSFEAFLSSMGRRPTPRHTLERRDNEGHYHPSNCVWATWREQSRNKRNNRWIAVNGETLVLTDMAERHGLKKTTLRERLRRGWSPLRAATTPVR